MARGGVQRSLVDQQLLEEHWDTMRPAEMQDAAFARVLEKIRPGMRDNDITALAQYEGRLLGSEQGLFLGSSAPLGQRSDFINQHQQGRVLQQGEHFRQRVHLCIPDDLGYPVTAEPMTSAQRA